MLFSIVFFSSCGILKNDGCNDCPNFSISEETTEKSNS